MAKAKEKVKETAKEIHEKIDAFEPDEEKNKKLKDNLKEEFKEYAEEATNLDGIKIYDDKPVIQKIVFILVGLTNFIIGFALYFLIKDDKKKKWQADYLLKSSVVGAIIVTIALILRIIYPMIEGLINELTNL